MNTILKLALLLSALSIGSQAAVNTILQTSLSGNITNNQPCFNLASVTGVTAGSFNNGTAGSALYIADEGGGVGEVVTVTRVTGTQVCTVRAGRAAAHTSGAMVLVATAANWFQYADPPAGRIGNQSTVSGTPTCAGEYVAPWVNVQNGRIWLCSDVTLSYTGGWGNAGGGGFGQSELLSSTATASVAGTTAIAGPFVKISGTNAITAFSMSTGWNGQGFTVYPTAAFTVTATNNICKAATAVADRVLFFVWDTGGNCFSPSY